MVNPLFTDETTGKLKQFDFAVANPPFSYKKWMNGNGTTHPQRNGQHQQHRLTQRIKEPVERYKTPLSDYKNEVSRLENKVKEH